jgi:uroporphyrinogen-III synthase
MMRRAWLVTRAAPGAKATVARLAALGLVGIAAPVLEIVAMEGADLAPAGAAALAFTSAAGVRAFAVAQPERALPAFTVGEGAAAAAKTAGFTEVHSADGDVNALARALIAARADPVLHISGEDQAGDLVATLRAAGLRAKRRIAYRAAPAPGLPPAAQAALIGDRLVGVMLYSARGAQAFSGLAAPFAAQTARLTAATLSPAVAKAANSLPWRRIAIAETPDEKAMLALVEATAPKA